MSWGLITGLPAHTQRSVGWLKRSSKRAVRLLTSTFGWMRLVLWLGIFQFGDVENTHAHNICISMGNHPILVCGFQWLFDVQPYFWDELPQKKGFSTVFSWDIFGRGRDMVFLYHNPLDSDGQLGRFQLEQISQTLGSWWQPVISGTRVSPCSKMFKVLSARVCRNFRPFFCGYEHVWSGLQWNPVFFGDQSDQKIGSCISPEKNVVDLLPRPGLSTTSKSTWGPPGGSACSQAYHDSLVVHHPLNRGAHETHHQNMAGWPHSQLFFFAIQKGI